MSETITISRLNGKIAIVTGSTSGIGYAIARRLAREGAKVIICSRKAENVEKAVKMLKNEGLDVTGIVCHVAKADDRRKLLEVSEKLGGVDILISNAAVNPEAARLFDASISAWDKTFEVNLKAPFLLVKEALPQLKRSKNGRILFISSATGYVSSDIMAVYSISKSALISLAKAAAIHLAEDKITVNCVAPGIIKTRFATHLMNNESYVEEALSKIIMKRFGNVDEVGGVVAFLASEDASYITGETVVVSGGIHCRL